MSFGTRLKELRESKGMGQSELARRSGISQAAISDLESGVNKKPSWETVLLLAKALGVDCLTFAEDVQLPVVDEREAKVPRGRPAKPASDEPEALKRGRGRPRKDGGA